MLRVLRHFLFFTSFLLVACASAPTGPSVAVMPGGGKSFEQFRTDDALCRQYASNLNSGDAQQANNKAVESGVVGTVIGAAAGAALGGREGTAVGAGSGLLVGSAVGANESGHGTYSAQRRYDISYEQCMYAKGNNVPIAGQMYWHSQQMYSPPPPPPPPPYMPR